MAKDANGADLKVGQRVFIPAIVTEIVPDAEDGHNVSLRSEGMISLESEQTVNFALNGRMVVAAPPGKLPQPPAKPKPAATAPAGAPGAAPSRPAGA